MTGNCGQTSLKRKPRRGNPMQDYDCLPPDLRCESACEIDPLGWVMSE
ncbi:DUF6525 family protein [Phaeobacter inhibens]|nr:DUF6525 family protein [Phaeobacter inhibens]WHP68120.1 DUF6525 family protein [Phaeobacter inhibens]